MIKVLIAEDNAVNRELLRELLELRGYAVLEACDGQEALHMIEQSQPELLLLDIGNAGNGRICGHTQNPRESSTGEAARSGSHRICHAR